MSVRPERRRCPRAWNQDIHPLFLTELAHVANQGAIQGQTQCGAGVPAVSDAEFSAVNPVVLNNHLFRRKSKRHHRVAQGAADRYDAPAAPKPH